MSLSQSTEIKIKPSVFEVETPEISACVQRTLFSIGCFWPHEVARQVRHTDRRFLSVDSDGLIHYHKARFNAEASIRFYNN